MKSILRSVRLFSGLAALAVLVGCGGSAPSVSVAVAPASGTTLAAGATQQFTATVTNDGTTSPGVTWSASVGIITSGGLYTAPTPVSTASATITATSKTDTTKTGTATVTLTPISVSIPTTPTAIAGGATEAITATVTGDTTLSQGVTWSITSGGGSLTSVTTAGVTYNAPLPVTTANAVITATSKTDTSKTSSITIPLTPISVAAVTPATVSLGVSQTQTFGGAAVSNDSSSSGVTWSISPSSGAGTINASTGAYTAPTTVISASSTVTVTATSVKDPTKTGTATITLQPIAVAAVTPATVSLAGAATQTFGGAAVTFDGTSSGVTWAVSPSTGAGTITSGGVYTAPAVVGSTVSATITATSVKDPSKSGTVATVTLLPISISLGATTSATLDGGQQYGGVTASITNDPSHSGVVFSVGSAGDHIGSNTLTTTTLTGAGPFNPIYFSPSTVPSTTTSTITVASVKDPTKTATFTVTLNPAMAWTTPSTNSATLTAAQTNTAYSLQFAVSGGTGTKSFTVITGAFPAGITLSNTGLLSGTATAVATGSAVSVRVTDQSSNPSILAGSYTLSVTAAPLVFNTPTLNTGTVGTAYSQQLTASGGTGALSYTVNTGTLAGTGLTLSSTGLLSGTPTADTAVAGTALTFKVTDSATPTPATLNTGSASLVINPITLAVTTTSLPGGTAGVAYSTTLTSTGGTGAVTWSQTAGTLPTGLNLNAATGVISGTVTSATTASGLAFKATDSDVARTAQTATASGLSLAIVSGTPPVITTTTLPNGTLNVLYSQSIATTGGTAPFTWSISAGSVPAGLGINTSTGVISGTPTSTITVTNTFTVKIVDAGGQSTTQQYIVVCGPTLAVGPNNSELNGSYAFLVNGIYNMVSGGNPVGSVYGVTVIGSVTLDGAGHVTSGLVDEIDARTNVDWTAVTGSYTVGSDNRGTIILNVTGPTAKSFTFAIAAGNVNSGVAGKIKMQEFDDINANNTSAFVATGSAKLQTAAAFVQPSGTYVFGLTGETPCNTCISSFAGHFGSINMAGYFAASGGTISSGTADAADYSNTYTALGLTGTTTAPVSGTGRGTLTWAISGAAFPAPPTHFVYYVISSNEMYIASTDKHLTSSGTFSMLSGDVQLQTIPTYSATSLTGNAIAWTSYGNSGNGTSTYGSNSGTSILELQFTSGSNAVSAINDENNGNNQTPNLDQVFATSLGVTYTLTTGGRTSLNGAGGGSPVFFFAGNGSGFGIDENNSGGGTGGLYTVLQQTGGPFSTATLGGFSGVISSVAPTGQGQGTTTGVISFNAGGGSGSTTQDNAVAGTLSPANTQALTYALDSNGSTTGRNTSSGAVIYIISPTKAVAMDSNAQGSPNISVVEK